MDAEGRYVKIYGAKDEALHRLQGAVIADALAGLGVEGEARERLDGEALERAVAAVRCALEADPRLG